MTINKLKEFVFRCKMLNDIFVKCLLYSFLKVGLYLYTYVLSSIYLSVSLLHSVLDCLGGVMFSVLDLIMFTCGLLFQRASTIKI